MDTTARRSPVCRTLRTTATKLRNWGHRAYPHNHNHNQNHIARVHVSIPEQRAKPIHHGLQPTTENTNSTDDLCPFSVNILTPRDSRTLSKQPCFMNGRKSEVCGLLVTYPLIVTYLNLEHAVGYTPY